MCWIYYVCCLWLSLAGSFKGVDCSIGHGIAVIGRTEFPVPTLMFKASWASLCNSLPDTPSRRRLQQAPPFEGDAGHPPAHAHICTKHTAPRNRRAGAQQARKHQEPVKRDIFFFYKSRTVQNKIAQSLCFVEAHDLGAFRWHRARPVLVQSNMAG